MLSKEEILNQFDRNEEYDSYFHEDHILKAMDEYAKQEAIEVLKWLDLNNIGTVAVSVGSSYVFTDTPEKLYQQYLNSKANATK